MSYLGMNAKTGRSISDDDHIAQSIRDIIQTPLGSRVGRRDYGSALFFLIDQPIDKALHLRIMSSTVIALTQYEPRIVIDSMSFTQNEEKLTLSITYYLDAQNNQQSSTKITSVEVK